jgi:hypothetical protein
MISKRKMWVGISIVAGAGAASLAPPGVLGAGQSDGGGEDGFPGGSFPLALKKVLAGEGGEGGIGMGKMRGGSLSIPALNGDQISTALSDNTLRRDHDFALHFRDEGSFSGWEVNWEVVDVSRCAGSTGKEYSLEEGVCWYANEITISGGAWTVRSDTLCTEPALVRVAEGESCVAMALILDKFALFAGDGAMIGKGNTLVSGERLEKVLSRK